MILEEDSLLQFNYDTASDILSVTTPDLIGTPFPQIENSMEKLARNIANFDVKKLLLDLRSGVPGLDEEHYRKVVKHFLASLAHSRLEKVARVIPESPAREYLIEHYSQEMREKLRLKFQARSFTGKAVAIKWLLEKD